jgi:hypothetical protein
MIPVISQFDDLEHSLIVQHIREYIMSEYLTAALSIQWRDDSLADAFALGWEGGCERLPSSQLSTFIDHYRTYLFKDHIATIECYMHDYLIPALEQIDQRSDRETPLVSKIVDIVQTQWKDILDLALNRQTFKIWHICRAGLDMVFKMMDLAREENDQIYSLELARETFGSNSLWGLAADIGETAGVLGSAIDGGRYLCEGILLPFTSSLMPSGELIKSASPY